MNTPDSTATPSQIGRWYAAVVIGLIVVAVGLAAWGLSERQRANGLAAAAADTDSWAVADLAAFEAAFESGDYEQVRALFAEDGVLTTASNAHYAIYHDDTSHLAERVGEAEFRRLATLHGGEDFQILGTPVQVGENTVAFAWQWDDGWVSGTGLLHLRDGKIVIAVLNPSQYHIPVGGGY